VAAANKWDPRDDMSLTNACKPPSIVYAMQGPFPLEIYQGTELIIIKLEYFDLMRVVFMDGRKPDATTPDSKTGFSVGRWEGDTLVVDVTDFNEETWFDRAGNFHSEALHVVERYTPVSPHHLMYEVTIEDPKVFTRPWKMRMPLYRRLDSDAQIREYKCVEFVEQLMYGHLGVVDPATGTINK